MDVSSQHSSPVSLGSGISSGRTSCSSELILVALVAPVIDGVDSEEHLELGGVIVGV